MNEPLLEITDTNDFPLPDLEALAQQGVIHHDELDINQESEDENSSLLQRLFDKFK